MSFVVSGICQYNLKYTRYKLNWLHIVPYSIFCFQIKSSWKKKTLLLKAISRIIIQWQVESPMHLQIMIASTRDCLQSLCQKKQKQKIPLWSNYHHFHWLWCFTKNYTKTVLLIWQDQIMTKAHIQKYLISMTD